ncbi:MAG: DEAD/DEAH box helicase family protein [Bacteroidia bacterium]|nr:DEAD/DEAH box helicase family protein [Bacteroidia bacterium]
MLNSVIKAKKDLWLNSVECKIAPLFNYIKNKGKLRDTQIEAIETYLFLKIMGGNKPLWQLFSEGFFDMNGDLAKLNINQHAREFLEKNLAARALFDFARQKNGKDSFLPELEKLIISKPENLDYIGIIKSIFYNVEYADLLFSLPMGAGKTYLMAAIIYLDLYFSLNEADNNIFAHNFIILAPSGLKSSIIPSLKTIEKFDPSWVLPEPSASSIKKMLRFEVLDQSKSAKKSNKARNPNAQKINHYLAEQDLTGLVIVVNAEKVILDRLELSKELLLIEKTDDEKDRYANELRNLIGKIPHLQIMIDEVHHAATDDIKLRQVVNKWHANGNITTVMGFSGTPYLSSPDKIQIDETAGLKFNQIANTVYYYPLISGIKSFLKKPHVKIAENQVPINIIEKGIEHFYTLYKDKVYQNGCVAKLAIYCGNIERLENEIYPYVVTKVREFGDTETNILKYHKGNKNFKIPKQNELEFNSLDLPLSKKRIVLLVQIGKEGWDCKSLTGVVLSQKGDCPNNMVLQTSCRCLRQVDENTEETAIVWLNEQNAKILEKQLKDEQNTSIQELNNLKILGKPNTIERFPRMEYLKLPSVDFFQMKINYHTLVQDENPMTVEKLKQLLSEIDKYKAKALIRSQRNFSEDQGTVIVSVLGIQFANFLQWVHQISKGSFNTVSVHALLQYSDYLKPIFKKLTYIKNKKQVFNELFDFNSIESKIRLAFSVKRALETKEELIKKDAELLLVNELAPVYEHEKLYPVKKDCETILELDKSNKPLEVNEDEIKTAYEAMIKPLRELKMDHMVIAYEQYKSQFDYSFAVKSKNNTFQNSDTRNKRFRL